MRYLSYRVLIAAAVPILWVARDITGSETARSPAPAAAGRTSRSGGVSVPDVRPVQLDPVPAVPEPVLSRNPFAYAPRSLPPPPPPSPVSMPDLAPSVALSLIGVATTTRADGRAERTAILTGPADALYFVREADAVTRYRVDAVLPDGVLLVDGATGVSIRLTLR